MSELTRISPARVLRELVPESAWEGLVGFPRWTRPAGAVLLRQGEPGKCVLALIRGVVKVVRGDLEGRDRLLAFRGPGEVLGEVAVQDGGGRLAHVLSVSRCEVSVIPADAFQDFVERHDLAPQLARHAHSRLREQTEACEGDIDQRLAAALLHLTEISGANSLSLTRVELAQHLGVGRNSISEALERFGSHRVRFGRTRIEVLDPTHLRRLAGRRAAV
ncbi:Crp/Fnr family transcriptional regulator [Streptomyces sp. NPDC086993]|uniref:Crp/Fnr family transcriptional regulator n=1 Tax=Streptomyces sp. NPDC086993 TaxID=3365765 RepID=UPI0038285871